MGSEVLASAAVEMDGTGRPRKGPAIVMGHMWVMGTVVGKEAGAVRWVIEQNCRVSLPGGTARRVKEEEQGAGSCRRASAIIALLVPTAVLKRRCDLLH